ncbi:MAG: F0F1 ATP synthase subunit alpha [Eubacteriales bacterium]|nr:F0F1 ATP synthase subunit alpha [Eubacteriales bacterium]
MNDNRIIAEFLSLTEPTAEQKEKLESFLKNKYNRLAEVKWVKDETVKKGFILKALNEVYDNTPEGFIRELKFVAESADKSSDDYISLVKDAVEKWQPRVKAREVGTVESVADGVAAVTGLHGVKYGEILAFDGGEKGLALDLNENGAGCILFDDENSYAGEKVYKTGKTAGVGVSDEIIGRVINALGEPIDGKGSFAIERYMPVESPAPAIIDRSPVNEPLKTGILTVDAMFPIGKGQRELIVGDRQTGKTSLAIDAILNQKGKNVICVYCAVGQKASTVKRLVKTLEENGALEYTVVVFSSAAESAPMQYIAPFSACAVSEYFMHEGKDVLVVYDDLSKHAVAYRTLSLLLGRSPGREAYPGDIFYLHSRLLERSAKLSEEKGGGSITALPIVETLGGDVSAYIPTNVISITDGQLFLESELFLSGQRPAVNVGLSVSRVGGSAQTKAMKKAVGSLRLELAQYREMKTFAQFSGDLDESVKNQFEFGKALTEILVQPLEKPYSEWQEVVILVVSLAKITVGLKSGTIRGFFNEFLPYFAEKYSGVVSDIESGKILSDDDAAVIKSGAERFIKEKCLK